MFQQFQKILFSSGNFQALSFFKFWEDDILMELRKM